MRRNTAQVLGIVFLACLLLAGLFTLLQRHAQQPDSYPLFSSYRTLPEGSSVLFDALLHTPGITAARNTQPLGAVHFSDAAVLMLGIQPGSLAGNAAWFRDMEELAAAGNRVIIGLVPHRGRFLQGEPGQFENGLKRWSVTLAFARPADLREDKEDLAPGWPLYFSHFIGWVALRQESGHAVALQRQSGKGSLVLVANAYPLSNAAMVDDRQTAFLAALIGPVQHVIFDESHFGIEETGSIAALARRYRLQGFLLGLVLTASLFIWKSAAGFPPPWNGPRPPRSVLGEDSSAAFLNLLRRNIRREDILSTCVDAWRGMYARKAGPALVAAVDLAAAGRKTPVQTYARIQEVLSDTRRMRHDGAPYNPS